MNDEALDLVRDVLDHEVVDAEGVPCGMVDDLELEGNAGSTLRVRALLLGAGAWSDRLPRPMRRLVQALTGRGTVRIPWSEVAVTSDRVVLASTAAALGLDAADRRIARWFERSRNKA